MSSSESVTVILQHSVKRDGKILPSGTPQDFSPPEAARLVARGAARWPEGPLVPLPEPTGELVKSFTPEGAKFARLGEKKAVELVLETPEAALLAECQALEYRRADGPRPAILEALQRALSALTPAPDDPHE